MSDKGIQEIIKAIAEFNPPHVEIQAKAPIDRIPEWGMKIKDVFFTELKEQVSVYRHGDSRLLVLSKVSCVNLRIAPDGVFTFNTTGTAPIKSDTYLAWVLLAELAYIIVPSIKKWLQTKTTDHQNGIEFHNAIMDKLAPWIVMDALGGENNAS